MRYIFATVVCVGIIFLTMFLNYEGIIPGFSEIGGAIGGTPSWKAFFVGVFRILYFSAVVGVWRAIAPKKRKSPNADTSAEKSLGSQKKGFWFGFLAVGVLFIALAFSGEFLEILRSGENPGIYQETTAKRSKLQTRTSTDSTKKPVYQDTTYMYANDTGNTEKKTVPKNGPKEGKTWTKDLGGGVTMEFVLIPAGSFMMGSDNGDADEKPERRVTLSKSFWMAKTEVTQAQYERHGASNPSSIKGANLPVERVRWNSAMWFCHWLTKCLSAGWECTLPTEAQWEYACRAGTIGDYAGDLDSMGWYKPNNRGKTHPVGTKQPNVWGLYDMHGNVYEWCSDWYGSGTYNQEDMNDPRGASSGSRRVIRGGCWSSDATQCRSANRSRYSPSGMGFDIGFRPIIQRK